MVGKELVKRINHGVKTFSLPRLYPYLILTVVSALLFFTSPYDGNFWWSDAPRHAMDGAFYLDAFKDLPFTDPVQYAYNYYIQYPALTILFYPPLFAVVEAFIFSLFGVSHAAAQFTVILFYAWAGIGSFVLVKRWLPTAQALAVALLFMGTHEIAFWGRQVMLDIPAYTFLIWATVVLMSYLERREPRSHYHLALLLAAGLYTKLNIAFAIPVFFLAIWWTEGNNIWRMKSFWGSTLLFGILILPLAIVTIKFGQVNVGAVMGGQTANEATRFSLEGWLYYLECIPDQIGWPVLILASIYFLMSVIKRDWRLPGAAHGLMLVWVTAGYVFFSMIALKEPRHSIFILFPIFLFAVLTLNRVFPKIFASVLALVLGVVVLGKSLFIDQVPYIGGYREAADFIAMHAPKNSTILFSGYRDGSFIFNLRSHEERRDLSVLRADKLLFNVSIKREMGVEENSISSEELLEKLSAYNVAFVVNEPRFWNDLAAMQRFQSLFNREDFKEVQRIAVYGNIGHDDQEIVIYRFQGSGAEKNKNITIKIPSIGVEVKGSIGK